jgi:uncharacterized protein YciI
MMGLRFGRRGRVLMIVVHVLVTTAEDYLTRREPHRQAHFDRLRELRAAGRLIGAGPAPDGRSAEVFYRVTRADELRPLIEEDPYYRAGAWTAYRPRSFSQFVEPWELPPIVLDGSRRATIAEGPTTDRDLAQLALVELRGAGRLAFGGSFEDGQTLAVLRTPDAVAASAWLTDTGFWAPATLSSRPFVYAI